ncbi:hypothetical protein MOQ_006597 [Trypanosoma cruzi marinkellei]|uniref:Trans-sialidase n=1 Tax=Trypanosoma cruzi marinkellei TaxID=85056 RepID=K2MVC0_TRYCR|nr:hypothetical protein MOQ_006597 [Trypanosoma cruzi marinkellei]
MRKANEMAREIWAPSVWERRMSLAGQFTKFCRTHEQPTSEESCATFLMAIINVAPPPRLQYARMLHSMSQMNRIPLDIMLLVGAKVSARSETRQAHPSTKEGVDQFIRSRTDWKERVVFRLVWVTAGRCSEIASLTPNNFTLEPGGAITLDWPVAPKTTGAGPHRAPRSVRIRGQDVFDTRKAHEYYDCPRGVSSGSLECRSASHKTGCVAARRSNRGDAQF